MAAVDQPDFLSGTAWYDPFVFCCGTFRYELSKLELFRFEEFKSTMMGPYDESKKEHEAVLAALQALDVQ